MNGTMSMGISYTNNRLICKYRRKLSVPAGSEGFMASLETNLFAIWGTSANIDNAGNKPASHMPQDLNERRAEDRRNLRFTAVSFTSVYLSFLAKF